MRLNLGCGDRYVDDWINVDWDSPHRMDERVDLRGSLPWAAGSVSRIYAGHLLEHLTLNQAGTLLSRLLVCANPQGATMVLVGPDVDIAERMVGDGTFDHLWGTLDMIRYGAGRWAGDEHLWETTGPKVAALAKVAGWPIVHTLSLDELEGGWPVADITQKWQYVVRAWVGQL